MHADRVGRVIVALDGAGWVAFKDLRETFPVYSALDAKQLTGTLMALENRRLVQHRHVHEPCGSQWRLRT